MLDRTVRTLRYSVLLACTAGLLVPTAAAATELSALPPTASPTTVSATADDRDGAAEQPGSEPSGSSWIRGGELTSSGSSWIR